MSGKMRIEKDETEALENIAENHIWYGNKIENNNWKREYDE